MLIVNSEKALLIAQEKIRRWRLDQFEKNDINLQNALVDGVDPTPFVERRDRLRDLPQRCIGKSTQELQTFLIDLGVIGGRNE